MSTIESTWLGVCAGLLCPIVMALTNGEPWQNERISAAALVFLLVKIMLDVQTIAGRCGASNLGAEAGIVRGESARQGRQDR